MLLGSNPSSGSRTAATAAAVSDPSYDYTDRVYGSLLGKMCGDVLGAAVEGWRPEEIAIANPEGLTSFLHTERGYGCYTDDTQMAIALTRSLLQRHGQIDDVHVAQCYAHEYDASRGYGGTAYKILSEIKQYGIDASSISTIGTKYIPNGSFGNGGAMRIAPLALVYRHAPPAVLRSAVVAALRVTHVHPTAIDGAFVIALAVSYLARRLPGPYRGAAAVMQGPAAAAAAVAPGGGLEAGIEQPPNGGIGGGRARSGGDGEGEVDGSSTATPGGLFDYLLGYAGLLETREMAEKVAAVRTAWEQAPQFKSQLEPWSTYLNSNAWSYERATHDTVSEPFQIRADDAAAVALIALTWHWECPTDAVVAAVHYGGDTDTIAAITGALCGALYGTKWLPQHWTSQLENGRAGRDEVLALAGKLAKLDTRN